MNKLKAILKKFEKVDKATGMTDEEKSIVAAEWDILNDDLRAKFAEAAPEEGAAEDEGEDDEEGGAIDEKALDALIDKKSAKYIDQKAEELAMGIAKSFADKFQAQRAKFMQTGETSQKNKENDEITRKFLRALLAKDYKGAAQFSQKVKAITTESDDDASAGVLIPEPLANEVIRVTSEGYGVARREFGYNLLTVGNTKRVTALGSALSVFWVDEGEKKPASQPSFSLVTLALKKLVVIVPFTEESVEDAGVDLTGLVAQLIREAVDKEVDLQFFNGDGTVFTGLLNDTSIPADTLAATKYAAAVRPEDIIGLEDNTPLSVNGKYYGHRTVLTKIRTIRQNADGTGDYIYNPLGGGDFGTINGRPFVPVEAMPTLSQANAANKPFLIYGDLKRGVAYGEKSDIKLKLLDQATITDVDGETVINLAEQDMLALRAVQRVGMKVTLPTAMRRLVSGPAS